MGRVIALCCACLLPLVMTVLPLQAQALLEQRRGECVVLLHGLWRTHRAMLPLQWYLDREGFSTVNHSYPSLKYPIEQLARMAVNDGVDECHAMGIHRVHFVTHSLGGILVRQYLSAQGVPGLERVVMLGPPNQGSQVADFVDSIGILDGITPRAITQLGTGAASVPLRLGPVGFELGVIAGTLREETWLPGFPDEVSDGTVSVAETVVPGMVDFLQMPTSHTFMIWNTQVMAQVVHFLEHGAFRRE